MSEIVKIIKGSDISFLLRSWPAAIPWVRHRWGWQPRPLTPGQSMSTPRRRPCSLDLLRPSSACPGNCGEPSCQGQALSLIRRGGFARKFGLNQGRGRHTVKLSWSRPDARVAQLVEQRFCKPQVVGSSPSASLPPTARAAIIVGGQGLHREWIHG